MNMLPNPNNNPFTSGPEGVYSIMSFDVESNPNYGSFLYLHFSDQEAKNTLEQLGQTIKASKYATDHNYRFRELNMNNGKEMPRIVDYDTTTFLYGALLGLRVYECLEGKENMAQLSEAIDAINNSAHEVAAKYPSDSRDEALVNSLMGTGIVDSEQFAIYLTLLEEPRIRAAIAKDHLEEAQDGMGIVLAAYAHTKMV